MTGYERAVSWVTERFEGVEPSYRRDVALTTRELTAHAGPWARTLELAALVGLAARLRSRARTGAASRNGARRRRGTASDATKGMKERKRDLAILNGKGTTLVIPTLPEVLAHRRRGGHPVTEQSLELRQDRLIELARLVQKDRLR